MLRPQAPAGHSAEQWIQVDLAKVRGQEAPLEPDTGRSLSIMPIPLVVPEMFFRCNTLPLPSSPCSDQKCHSSAKYNTALQGALEWTFAPAVALRTQPAAVCCHPSPQMPTRLLCAGKLHGGLWKPGPGPWATPPIFLSGSWRLSHVSWWCLCWKWGVICASWLVSCHNKQWAWATLFLWRSWGAVFAHGLCEGGGQPPRAPYEQFPFCCFISHMVFWNSSGRRERLSVLT